MATQTGRCEGFFGKLPAYGDFVRSGLHAVIVSIWDRNFSRGLLASKLSLGDDWVDVWLESPVWRFTLPDGLCGPTALLGLWMPSVDKVGRYFPLMIAATCPGATPETMARHATAWLDLAEDAGRAAIAEDVTWQQLKARIPPLPDLAATPDAGLPYDLRPRPGAGLWWTDGSPRVNPQGLVLDTWPDVATFMAMLDPDHAAP